VLAIDLLQSIPNKAKKERVLKLPIRVGYTEDFPIIQYADDTLLIMEACPRQLIILRAILNSFVASTGLKVNYSKSNMFPINVSQERLQHLAATFNCQVGAFPSLILACLSMNKPFVQDYTPLVTRIERRLVNTSNFLS
jgi:hypothetical protein